MTFVMNNFDQFQRNITVPMLNTRSNDHLHIPITHLSAYQRSVYYSGVKLFNILPKQISALKNYKNQFSLALRSYLLGNSFYSIQEFIEHGREQR
jgi:hypothetical protein